MFDDHGCVATPMADVRGQRQFTRYKTPSVIYRSEDRWRMPGSPNVSCQVPRGSRSVCEMLTGPTGAECRNSDAGSHATSSLESAVGSKESRL